MALNFPSSPISGQTYQSGSSPYYIFNGNYWEIDRAYVVNGTSGTSGTSGIGSSGTDGTSGTSGTSGSNGLVGLHGTSGTSGSSGTSGVSGTSGSNGSSGTSGTSGTAGSSGSSGSSGIGVSASYMRGSRSTQQTSGLTTNSVVVFTQTDNSTGSDISLNTSTGRITLEANRTYRLMGMVPNFTTSGGDVRPQFCWYNETTSTYIGSSAAAYVPSSAAAYGTFYGPAEAVITTNTTTVVSFRFLVGSSSLVAIGGSGDFSTTGSYPWFDIEVISGNSPLVNGTSGTSGTSGLVDYTGLITTGSISTTQNITGSVIISGSLNIITTSQLQIGTGSGDEGGEILLAKAITNTTLSGSGITIDSYRDRLRIFEQGGNARGAYLDITSQSNGVSSEILTRASTNILATPVWTSAGAISISGTTTAPTKGTTTKDNISYRQLGTKQWEVVMTYFQTANTGAANGSGDYLFTLPNSLSFDMTIPSQTQYQANVGTSSWYNATYVIPSGGGMISNGATGGKVFPVVYNSTQFRILAINDSAWVKWAGSGHFQLLDNTYVTIQLTFRFTST